MTAASDGEHRAFKARKLLPDNAHTVIEEEISESDDSDDDDEEQFARIDMEALRQRGKGAYYCPKGHRCDKGGVDKDGNLVLFDRNSSFAYVVDTPCMAFICGQPCWDWDRRLQDKSPFALGVLMANLSQQTALQ